MENYRIGKERVSFNQRQLLSQIRSRPPRTIDVREIAHYLMRLIDDDDLRRGTETIDPDWQDIYKSHREYLDDFFDREMLSTLDLLFRIEVFDPLLCEIDFSSEKLCFLLGAGASKPAPSGIPTVKELLPDLLERARRLDREEVTRLAEFCELTDITNIEDVLTAAHISEYCGRNPTVLNLLEHLLLGSESRDRRLPRSKPRVDVASVAFLQDTLQVLFGLLSNRMLPAEPNAGHTAIAQFVSDRTAESSVITTNYDCCIDRAMKGAGLQCNYCLDGSEATHEQVRLLKLHGSLNWFYCQTCQELTVADIDRMVQDYTTDAVPYPVIGVCRVCGGQRRGLLVPPLAMKFDVAPPLNPLIDHAGRALADASVIVVVGFSFADADIYISRMVAKAMQGNPNCRIVILDPESVVETRIRRKFALQVPDFNEHRVIAIRGDCAEYLPKMLNGELYQTAEEAEENVGFQGPG